MFFVSSIFFNIPVDTFQIIIKNVLRLLFYDSMSTFTKTSQFKSVKKTSKYKRMKNSFIILLVVCTLGCREKKVPQIANIPIEVIDFESLNEINENIPKKFIKNKSYINISTANEDLLFGNIDHIKIKNDRIFIIDSQKKIFAVFDIHGNGIGKIGSVGRAPQEYLNTTSFSIDSAGRIYLIDGNIDKINIYDKDFKFINSRPLPFEVDIIHCLPSGHLLLGLSSWNTKKNAKDKIIETDSNLLTQKSYHQYDEYIDNNTWFSDYYFTETAHSIFYNRPLDNIVYEFSKTGSPRKGYYFDFGKKEIPSEVKKDFEKYADRYKNTRGLIFFTVVSGNYILGQLREDNGYRGHKVFLIDRTMNTVYIEDKSIFSTLGYVIGCDGDRIISRITPGEYLVAISENKEVNLPPEVKKHLENEGFVLCISELSEL